MSSTKPTIVIVPGSFSAPGAYTSFLILLRSQGFTAVVINLPSTQKRFPLEPATLQDDASHVRGMIGALLAEKEGTEVVVLAHSYGGTVATEALAGMGIQGEGKSGVKRLIFLSATAPKVGETQISAMQLDEAFLPPAVGGYMHSDPVIMAAAVFNDLPYAQAYEAALMIPHHSAESFRSEITAESWRDIPLTYIFCEKDLVIVPETQQRFIDTIEEVSGRKVDVRKIDAGHCPTNSRPEELSGLVAEAAAM